MPMNDPYARMSITAVRFTPPAGGYRVGNGASALKFMLSKRPNWVHRAFSRLLLGWVWEDG